MKFSEIRRMATDTSEFARMKGENDPKIHESIFRSFHIVNKVKELLLKNTPYDVVIEIIDDLQNAQIYNENGETGNAE
jgi:hypothetical protein